MNTCPNCTNPVAPGIAFCPECGARIAAQSIATLQERYELTQKLGQGGMGAVYLARDRRLSTVRWAVKELSDAQISDPQERQQAAFAFRREAELLASLNHPNLPRVTDHFTEDGKSYLVMELVEGESLQAFIEREGLPRPVSEVLGWVEQLCAVLHYLHSQRPPVIFRDLKPSNIMLTPTGQVKLIDFGIARLFKPGQATDTQAFGTMGYSAPEQYGQGQTDQRSDIYSLAVVSHQLLTGYDPTNTPFRLPAAAQLNPQVPPALSEALERAMHNDRAQRFADVSALRQVLRDSSNLAPAANVEARSAAPPVATATPQAEGGMSAAKIAFWMGVISMVWMVGAMGMVVISQLNGGSDGDAFAGFGIILGMPPLVLGPTAAVFALISLFKSQPTPKSKREAAVGVAAGVFTILLCCVTMALFV
ncbi:MAG: serine/threonine protein kinase [Candidatus Viridilinea halotolerans]|uniref:Serine/threonine protein kinase n=1 Tax=Candidatus Viridilinea halotolerans TaxID=2491704 RepID=A0A426TWD2_9CHLR|nr:MAG: serine/threonine protein kinase [Candidatus Viridilinea halotolerans]